VVFAVLVHLLVHANLRGLEEEEIGVYEYVYEYVGSLVFAVLVHASLPGLRRKRYECTSTCRSTWGAWFLPYS
jgi:hypothetical protein